MIRMKMKMKMRVQMRSNRVLKLSLLDCTAYYFYLASSINSKFEKSSSKFQKENRITKQYYLKSYLNDSFKFNVFSLLVQYSVQEYCNRRDK